MCLYANIACDTLRRACSLWYPAQVTSPSRIRSSTHTGKSGEENWTTCANRGFEVFKITCDWKKAAGDVGRHRKMAPNGALTTWVAREGESGGRRLPRERGRRTGEEDGLVPCVTGGDGETGDCVQVRFRRLDPDASPAPKSRRQSRNARTEARAERRGLNRERLSRRQKVKRRKGRE